MQDPIPTFSHLFSTILTDHPELAYVHAVEPRADGDHSRTTPISVHENNDFIRDIVREKGRGTKFISAGGYTRETAIEDADKKGDLIAFGRPFLANVGALPGDYKHQDPEYVLPPAGLAVQVEEQPTSELWQSSDVLSLWQHLTPWLYRLSNVRRG